MNHQCSNCLICNMSVPQTHLVLETTHWRIRHSQETNILGYCILEPLRHFLDLSDAAEAELADYGLHLSAIMKAQREILDCERVYTFSLAEAVPHFHVHVIPRAASFIRAYRGRGIMSYPTLPAADSNLVESVNLLLRKRISRCLTVIEQN